MAAGPVALKKVGILPDTASPRKGQGTARTGARGSIPSASGG